MTIALNSRGYNRVSISASFNVDRAEAWWEVCVYLQEHHETKLYTDFAEAAAFYKLSCKELEAVTL